MWYKRINEHSLELLQYGFFGKTYWINDLQTLYKIANGLSDGGILEMLHSRVTSRSVRSQRLFCTPLPSNNVSQNNSRYRMCVYYEEICTDCDVFNCGVPAFMRSLLALLQYE